MPRRLLGIVIILLVFVSLTRAQGETVLLHVGPLSVSRAEFEYHFSRSPQADKQVFLRSFIDYKLKVLAAKDQGLDTLSSYLNQREYYRGVNTYRKGWGYVSNSLQEREWIKLVHVTCPLSQRDGKAEERKALHTLDSLYAALDVNAGLKGIGEEMPWMQSRHLLKEWQAQLDKLPKNRVSRPFSSPSGVHLVAWVDKHTGRDVPEQAPVSNDEEIPASVLDEALLVCAWDAYLSEHLPITEEKLKSHFKRHRADYGGGVPHYRGAVIHCQNKKEAKAIKKYLKKYPQDLWEEAIARIPEKVSKACRIEVGLFPIGTNAYVDKLVFKCGGFEPLADYPYTWVMGKRLKKGPTDYRDVRQQVANDCRKEEESEFLRRLEQKYRVEVDEEVLKTVNRYGNK